jgi:hypothetical protein
MEAVMLGIPNVLVYKYDLLIYSKTHGVQLEMMDMEFSMLRAHNLKIRLPNFLFCSKDVSCLGCRLSQERIN